MREREGNGRGREMLGGLGVIKKGKGSCRVLGGSAWEREGKGRGEGREGTFLPLKFASGISLFMFFFFSLLS